MTNETKTKPYRSSKNGTHCTVIAGKNEAEGSAEKIAKQYLNGDNQTQSFIDDDLAWFESNPERLVRMRVGQKGEMGGINIEGTAVFVIKVNDATRMRVPFTRAVISKTKCEALTREGDVDLMLGMYLHGFDIEILNTFTFKHRLLAKEVLRSADKIKVYSCDV